MLSLPFEQTGAAAPCPAPLTTSPRLLLTGRIVPIARPAPCALPLEWTLDANGSGEDHGLALADHEVVFTSAEFVSETVQQASVHAPLGDVRRYRSAQAVHPVDVDSLFPVILRHKPIKAFPLMCFTVHNVSIPVIPVCVLFVSAGVWIGVLRSVWAYCTHKTPLHLI